MPPKIIASYKKNPWVDSWQVAGTSGHEYKVSRRADGVTFGCECKTWLYAPAPKPDCQHILRKKLELAEEKLKNQAKPMPILIQKLPGKVVDIESLEYYTSEELIDEAIQHEFGLSGDGYYKLKKNTLALCSNGGKVDAIKYVFTQMKPSGWGLLISKNFVDRIIQRFPLTSTSSVGMMSPKLRTQVKVEAEPEGRRFRGEDD